MSDNTIKIGTRGSKLALYQANRVKEELDLHFPEIKSEIVVINTKGDKILDVALSKIGDKGLFTKELEVALMNGEIHMAVHSLKDMPTELPEGLKLGAVLERGEINDAFVSRDKRPLKEFSEKEKIATSSLRRVAGLLHLNPRLKIVDIRGNVQTRLKKMKEGYCDAMIMAAAGLKRLGLEEHITEIIPTDVIIPAVGQGTIGIEVKKNDGTIEGLLKKLNHHRTWRIIMAERAFMRRLQGGCQVPAGCYSEIKDSILTLNGFVASLDAKQYLSDKVSGSLLDSKHLGMQLADKLIDKGGDRILKEIRESI